MQYYGVRWEMTLHSIFKITFLVNILVELDTIVPITGKLSLAMCESSKRYVGPFPVPFNVYWEIQWCYWEVEGVEEVSLVVCLSHLEGMRKSTY